jgi:ectoine hydroxylase-related dioxygenase (phytanoyl-CoA dioxygenase family)
LEIAAMTRIVVKDVDEYGAVELAKRYPSTAGSQPEAPKEDVDRCMEAVERDGYVVIENLIAPELVAEIKEDLIPRFVHESGRNNFEGFKTQRLYAFFEKSLVCNPLVEHPLILGCLDRIFEPNYLLSQLQAINILPGEAQQPLHHDDLFYRVPRPRRALGAATIWAIDPFTEENGATVVVPRSHLWDERKPTEADLEGLRSVVMPAGSVVFFLGTLWHAGGANRSDKPRLCVSAQYCAPWCRTQENYSLSLSRETVKKCSEHIQRMLGYSIHAPFMGFVDGKHPRRLLED